MKIQPWDAVFEVVPVLKMGLDPCLCHVVLEARNCHSGLFIVFQGQEPHIFNSMTGYKEENGSSSHKLMKDLIFPKFSRQATVRDSPLNTWDEVKETSLDGCVWKFLFQ